MAAVLDDFRCINLRLTFAPDLNQRLTARAAAAPVAGADHQLTDPGADLPYLAPDPDARVLITAADRVWGNCTRARRRFNNVLFGMTVKPIFLEKRQLFVKPLFYE